jgi:hypothetical protein
MRDRRERFVSLAEARTDKVLNAMRLLGNLANKSNYDYSSSDVEQIIRALKAEVRTLESKFADEGAGRSKTFKLQ